MPQRENICSSYHYTAENAVTQFAVVVEGTADGEVDLPGGADVGAIVGVAQHAAAAGARVNVAEPGSFTRAIASGSISRGANVSIAGVSGAVKTAAPSTGANTFIVGQAKSDASDGEQVFIQINPSVMQGA